VGVKINQYIKKTKKAYKAFQANTFFYLWQDVSRRCELCHFRMWFITAGEAGCVRVSLVCFVPAERCEADAGTLTVHDETGNVIGRS